MFGRFTRVWRSARECSPELQSERDCNRKTYSRVPLLSITGRSQLSKTRSIPAPRGRLAVA
jgi:hypothetical protein